jgi:hypothetical protein
MASGNAEVVRAMDSYVRGVGDGLLVATVAAQKEGVRLYCQPAKLSLGTANYKKILDEAIKTLVGFKGLEDMQIDIVLLMGLKETFPCSDK